MLSKVLIKQIISLIILCFLPSVISAQSIEIKSVSSTINTKNAEFNFFQKDSITAYYSAIYSAENLDQSAIFKTIKKDNEWQTGRYFSLGDFYSVANIFIAENGLWYFSACEEQEQTYNIYSFDKQTNQIEKLSKNINSKKYNSTQPHITEHNNQKVIYFVSDRKDGFGGTDIWVSIIDKKGGCGIPVNLGPQINTEYDEITPFYNHWNDELFFSSNNKLKQKGFDIYSSKGKLNFWKKRKEMFEFNTDQDEMYLNFFDAKRGYFSSNRNDSLCCNDVFFFNYNISLENPTNIDLFTKYLPLNLYFHNDEPDCCTMSDTTEKTYEQAYVSYFKMEEEYINLSQDSTIKDFFTDSLKGNFNKLNIILEQILIELQKGKQIELKIKGYASPLYKKDYNINLSKRRINSFINYLKTYRGNIFLEHIKTKKLEIVVNSFGESKSLKTTSDNPRDKQKSIYSLDAALERKIEIIDVISQ